MAFDINSAIPTKEREVSVGTLESGATPFADEFLEKEVATVTEPSIGFDINSAKPVSTIEQMTFNALDSSNILITTAKDLFRGVERIPAGIGSGMEFLGKDIVAETTSPTTPVTPFIRSWRKSKGPTSKAGEAIDNMFLRFGTSLAEIGKTTKDFYNETANKGIESPNPAVMMGWKYPFRKTISLAAENFPMLGLAAGVTAVAGPTAGAAVFVPQISGDMYEDAIKHGVDPHKATDMAIADGTVQWALENIVLGNWMKGGSLLKRIFRTGLQEGLIEEGTQQLFENGLKMAGWKEPRSAWDRITDGLAESILAGTVSGGALGMFQAPSIDDIRYDLHQEITKDGLNQGLEPEQISLVLDKVDEVIDKTMGIEQPKDIKTYEIKAEEEQAIPEAAKLPIAQPGADLKGETGIDLEGLKRANPQLFNNAQRAKSVDEFINKMSNGKPETVDNAVLTDFYNKVNGIVTPTAKGGEIARTEDGLIKAYHGTTKSFTEFDINAPKLLSQDEGIHFTTDKKYAEEYAFGLKGNLKGEVKDVYLDIKNPLYVKSGSQAFREGKKYGWRDKQDIQALKDKGYDGIIINNGEEVIVFDKSQIVSKLSPKEGKEPWQMSKEEWIKTQGKRVSGQSVGKTTKLAKLLHRDFVKIWIKEGRDINPEVLALYPELSPKEDEGKVTEIDTNKYDYFYKGAKLYNIKKMNWSYTGKVLQANYIGKPTEGSPNAEKLGEFQLKDLEIKSKEGGVEVKQPTQVDKMREGLSKKILDTKIKYDEGIMTRREFLEKAAKRGAVSRIEERQDEKAIERLKQQRKDLYKDGMHNINAKKIAEVDAKIKEGIKKTEYHIVEPDETFLVVGKTEYDYFNSLKQPAQGEAKVKFPNKPISAKERSDFAKKMASDEEVVEVIDDNAFLGSDEDGFYYVKKSDGTKVINPSPIKEEEGVKVDNTMFLDENDAIETYKAEEARKVEEGISRQTIGKLLHQPAPAYAIAPGEEIPSERQPMGRGEPKYIPPVTATGTISWEQNEAWKVNLGRDITGVFEREIGPKLQISKRLKKFLGVYYPTLGQSGLIRVKTLADEMTLFHEAGHFLDDSLSSMTGWNVGQRGITRDELLKVTHYVSPFTENRVPIIDKETGLPKKNKRTGEILTKFDTYTNYRRESRELFAQYLALYVNDPIKAKELAPTFTALVEQEIAKDKEFAYIVTKLREFEAQMKPIKEYVNSLRKIPEFQKDIKEWVEKGNILQELWRNKVGDKLWDVYSKGIENLGKKLNLTAFFEKGGLNEAVTEVLRQRRKLIKGQQQKMREELIDPISELGKEDQQFISESLQRFETLTQDTELNKLTEGARQELALWGNEARKLGLLNDEVFWNNIGQYFPFFYETKEFEKNKRSFGYFPSKALRANFSSLKHKLTDEEFGRKVLEAQYGTWPSGKKKIAGYAKEELEKIGRNAREELGLIKTAAYPLQRRLFGMIEMVYTVKAFNVISTLPGIIGHKGVEGYEKMPEGKKYGPLSGEYVSVDLVKEVSKWNNMMSDFDKLIQNANVVWKLFKVPYNPAAVSRNMITNAMMAWMGDIPIYNPAVTIKGLNSFIKKDNVYQLLRDRGLYHNTYSEQELKQLAFVIDEDPNNPYQQIQKWANDIAQVIQSPGRLYGAIEDASKTVIARYVLDTGGTPEQAVKFADKLLFDYSQVSEVTDKARKFAFPFFTWSAKILPRMVEFGIRKPEKFIMLAATTQIFSALARLTLGIDRDEEEKLKPDYIRGKMTILLPNRDINGDLNWIDLTYMLPWGGWLPVEKGRLAIPQTLTMGNPFLAVYNAFVLNHDPFYGEIAPDYLPDDEKLAEQWKYVAKSLGPNILSMTPNKVISSFKEDKYRRKGEPIKVLFGELSGIKLTRDISPYRGAILNKAKSNFYKGNYKIQEQVRMGELSRSDARKKVEKLKDKFKQEKESH